MVETIYHGKGVYRMEILVPVPNFFKKIDHRTNHFNDHFSIDRALEKSQTTMINIHVNNYSIHVPQTLSNLRMSYIYDSV